MESEYTLSFNDLIEYYSYYRSSPALCSSLLDKNECLEIEVKDCTYRSFVSLDICKKSIDVLQSRYDIVVCDMSYFDFDTLKSFVPIEKNVLYCRFFLDCLENIQNYWINVHDLMLSAITDGQTLLNMSLLEENTEVIDCYSVEFTFNGHTFWTRSDKVSISYLESLMLKYLS